MGDNLVLTGMVLTAMPIGEYDKRITILTTERGKITAFARGAKRPNSQLAAGTNPFAFGEFELSEGKNAYNLHKTTIKNHFWELTMDPEAAYMGFYFLEFAEYVCQENNDEKEMLKLLYQSLRALQSPAYKKQLVRLVFELKAMTINGEGPGMFSCMHCHRRDQLTIFSVRRGGMFCSSCGAMIQGEPISEAARYTMQYICASKVEKLYSFALKDEVLAELTAIMREYMDYYVKHRFKSLQILEESSAIMPDYKV